MEFQVNSKILNSHIKVAQSAIAKNPVLPILENFLFSLQGDKLTISASNLEITIVSKIDVVGFKDGKKVVEAETLVKLLSTLPDIEITIKAEDNVVLLKTKKGEYQSPSDIADDFPNTPEKEEAETFEIESSFLESGLSKTIFSVSDDDLRLAMTGVYFHVSDKELFLVATDAHKLVEYKLNGDFGLDKTALVPKNALTAVQKIVNSGNVSISINHANIFFETDNVLIVARLIDAKFPQYKSVLPENTTKTAQVDKKELLSAIKRSLIYTNKSTNQVNITFTPNMLDVGSLDVDMSRGSKESILCKLEGTDEYITGFNGVYLQQILSVITDENVTFEMTEPNRAAVIKQSNNREDILFLIMPVLVKN